MKEMWNSRYQNIDYVYGEEPNQFFKETLVTLKPGKILLPADGEGRNGVFAAENQWDVQAYDFSEEGCQKAKRLASRKGVVLDYKVCDHQSFKAPTNYFDVIALIYVHTDEKYRRKFHHQMITYLKPGGMLILEGFAKEQINNDTGGPKNIDLLFSKEDLMDDFLILHDLKIANKTIYLNEGEFHKGESEIIRVIGTK